MAETNKKRKIRYTDNELGIIKNTFIDNEEVIVLLRKIFLQIPLTDSEISLLSMFRANSDLLKVLRKTFLPTIDVTAPLHQVIDLWMTVDIKEKGLELCELNLVAREILIDYLEQQLSWLEDGKEPKIMFTNLTKIGTRATFYKTVSNFIMRNTLLGHIEQQLQQLVLLAGTKDETPEQTLERLARDSTR